jgi:hypothetical protein
MVLHELVACGKGINPNMDYERYYNFLREENGLVYTIEKG